METSEKGYDLSMVSVKYTLAGYLCCRGLIRKMIDAITANKFALIFVFTRNMCKNFLASLQVNYVPLYCA